MVFESLFQIILKYIFKPGIRTGLSGFQQNSSRAFCRNFFITQMLRCSLTACCDFRDKEIVRILLLRKKTGSGLPAINAYISFPIFAGNTAYENTCTFCLPGKYLPLAQWRSCFQENGRRSGARKPGGHRLCRHHRLPPGHARRRTHAATCHTEGLPPHKPLPPRYPGKRWPRLRLYYCHGQAKQDRPEGLAAQGLSS